jgi:hypothetical protein
MVSVYGGLPITPKLTLLRLGVLCKEGNISVSASCNEDIDKIDIFGYEETEEPRKRA